MTLTVTEHIEKQSEEPQAGQLISTGGDELVEDIADVLSFSWNLTVSTSSDLVARLVPDTLNTHSRRFLTGTFARTFDPEVVLTDADIAASNAFITQLIALHRVHYEVAMRAIRRLIIATRSALEDPTMAYADIVALLESLSSDCACHPKQERDPSADTSSTGRRPNWEQINRHRRQVIDAALASLPAADAERVRAAILESERTGAQRRFVGFVLAHLEEDYYGAQAARALRPLRHPDAERLLLRAYDIRSQHVHSLYQLPREASDITMRAETFTTPDARAMLTLEGLARLSRHVIWNYVMRAPTDVDTSFVWRAALPGRYQMRLAPSHWVHDAADFAVSGAPRYFEGLVECVLDFLSGRAEGVVDMSEVLAEIERQARGLASGEAKTTMIAIYALWHRFMQHDLHRPKAEVVLRRHAKEVSAPSMQMFVVEMVVGRMPDWTLEQWESLVSERLQRRTKGSADPLPAGFDAALHVVFCDKLWTTPGRQQDAIAAAQNALREKPGDPQLIELASALLRGDYFDVQLQALLGVTDAP